MAGTKRNWDLISDDQRKSSIEGLVTFFKTERDEQIGIVAAEQILDFILSELATTIYNKGVEDARCALQKRSEDLEIDLNLLIRS